MSIIPGAAARWLRNIFPNRAEWRDMRAALALAIASGLALRLAYSPIEWAWLPWIALAPFLAALQGRPTKQAAWIGWLFGCAFYYPNLTWLNTLSSVNPLAPVGIAFLAAACALYAAAFGAGAALFMRRLPRAAFFLVPAWWAALEYIRSLGEMGFPWIYLGHTQAANLLMIQICDLTGVYGPSFAIVFTATALARAAFARRKWSIVESLAACGLIGMIALYGHSHLREAPAPEVYAASPRVAIVQPGVPQDIKLASYASSDARQRERLQADMIRDLHAALRQAADTITSPPLLYVLPESAITDPYFNMRPELVRMVEGWSRMVRAPIFFGANRFDPPPGVSSRNAEFYTRARMYNSAYLAHPANGLERTAYDKMHLVPFGEYASYFDAIPGFTEYILGIGNFTPGATWRIFRAGRTRFASLICFESCFPALVRQYAAAEAVDWIAVVTNDAWYKRSTGARRHQTQSVFRAIESRLPIVRAANTGISCVIDPWGRTLAATPLIEGETRFIDAPLPVFSRKSTKPTLYMRPWGEWFAWLCISSCIAAAILLWIKGKNDKGSAKTDARSSP